MAVVGVDTGMATATVMVILMEGTVATVATQAMAVMDGLEVTGISVTTVMWAVGVAMADSAVILMASVGIAKS
jgi:hypothetical protein